MYEKYFFLTTRPVFRGAWVGTCPGASNLRSGKINFKSDVPNEKKRKQ
jgi:hypothetical protein